VVGPQLHHRVTLHAGPSPPPSSPSSAAPPSPPAATADGVLTRALNTQCSTGSPTQFHAPTQRREGRECVPYHCGAVRMCACHGLEQGGTYRESLLRTLSGCRVQYSVSLGTGSLGLRDRSAIPASVPGPVWLSATGHRACPRVRRRVQPAHPLSTAGRVLPAQLVCTHLCCVPFHQLAISWGSLRGRTARRQREARWVQHGQLV
jgi:hypothetical protein